MKIAIMQPYLFPYIGYFSLLKNTDYFLFFDTPQYIRKGWINRNRILKSDGSAIYFTIPIEKQHREATIDSMKVIQNEEWENKILGQLSVYKNKAPFYKEVIDVVKEVLNKDYQYISEVAIDSVVQSCRYLGINLNYDICSKIELPDFNVKEPDEWALYLTKYMKYDTYVNPPGGKSFFSYDKYKNNNIKLQFLTQDIIPYDQRIPQFVPGLSIIDIMMFCKPEDILLMMNNYKLEGDI